MMIVMIVNDYRRDLFDADKLALRECASRSLMDKTK